MIGLALTWLNSFNKSEVHSVTNLEHRMGPQNFKKPYDADNAPLPSEEAFVIQRLGLAVVNLCNKYNASIATHSKDGKDNI